MEKIVVKMEKIVVKMEKIVVKNGENSCEKWRKWRNLLHDAGRDGASTSWLFVGDTRNVHNVACSAPKCDFGAEKTPE